MPITNKKMNTEFAAGSLKIVAPRWKPSQVIKWVQDKSLDGDKDNSGFFFYETNRGFNFLSLSTLMNKEKLFKSLIFISNLAIPPNLNVKKGLGDFLNLNNNLI